MSTKTQLTNWGNVFLFTLLISTFVLMFLFKLELLDGLKIEYTILAVMVFFVLFIVIGNYYIFEIAAKKIFVTKNLQGNGKHTFRVDSAFEEGMISIPYEVVFRSMKVSKIQYELILEYPDGQIFSDNLVLSNKTSSGFSLLSYDRASWDMDLKKLPSGEYTLSIRSNEDDTLQNIKEVSVLGWV
ncbi:MAG: hypothetical protein U0525_06160 [Patescibacteria group bacterium]